MHLTSVAMAITTTLAATTGAFAQSDWDWSGFLGEGQRAVLGCTSAATDEDWVCLVVRCETQGALGLYAELSDFEIPGPSTLRIGDERFVVQGTQETGDAPYTTRLEGDIAAIADAMKRGAQVVIERDAMAITPGFDTIPLRGSSAAIAGVEQACGAPQGKGKQKAAADGLLPLRHGIYVQVDVACTDLSHATTLSFWGDRLNAQRVEGLITAVSGTAPDFRITLDATDITMGESLGPLEWPIRIDSQEAFSLTDPDNSYRWCFDAMP